MTAASVPAGERMVVDRSKRPNPFQRMALIWKYRELLRNLVRKELKVKYKNSALGAIWPMLNPALYLVVFYVVFQIFLKSGIHDFAVFFLSGLLAWTLFSNSLGGACGSIVNNASLVQKVWFPREILPIAAIGAALMHFFFQATVLLSALILFQRTPYWQMLPLVAFSLITTLVFTAGLGLLLAAWNVYLRDVQHLLELALLAWFWLSAVVYPFRVIDDRLAQSGVSSTVALLNPVIPIVITFQKAIYNPTDDTVPTYGLGWYATILSLTFAGSFVLLLIGLAVFGRLEDDFAEEI
jgi:ABC-2 type transport system permease protein